MGRKSTHIHSLEAIATMAQIGSFVKCYKAKIKNSHSILERASAGHVQCRSISVSSALSEIGSCFAPIAINDSPVTKNESTSNENSDEEETHHAKERTYCGSKGNLRMLGTVAALMMMIMIIVIKIIKTIIMMIMVVITMTIIMIKIIMMSRSIFLTKMKK